MTSYFLRTVFVHTPGTRLVLDVDAMRALRENQPPRRLPLSAIDSIVVLSGVDVSTPLLVRCAEDGRTVVFLSRFGHPRAVVEGALAGRGSLRRRQYARHFDLEERTQMARDLVAGKLTQMEGALRTWARDADAGRRRRFQELAGQIASDAAQLPERDRAGVLGTEGTATRRYSGGLGLALKIEHDFEARQRRPPREPVNAALSFLYGMARVASHGAVHAAGLDPYCGFLHGDRDSQPSLVLDLMEEFRPDVDRLAVRMFNRRELREEHFATSLGGGCSFTDGGREVLMNSLHRLRQQQVSLKGVAGTVPWASVPVIQANHLANVLRNGGRYQSHQLVTS